MQVATELKQEKMKQACKKSSWTSLYRLTEE